jgi:hypothetical protein
MRQVLSLLLCWVFLFLSLPLCTGAPAPFFHQSWGQDFHRRALESGDTLSVGAVFCDGSSVFIHDQAAGTIVILDSKGKKTAMVALEGIGRGTYCGDDFVVKDSLFIFVNTVDKRLEYFDRSSGKHISADPLPLQPLAGESMRSWRVIDRIFIIGRKAVVGNAHLLFDLGQGLKKTVSPNDFIKASGNERFAVLAENRRITIKEGLLVDPLTGKEMAVPKSRYTINGKRIFMLNNRLFALMAEPTGITIVELK